MTPGWRDWRPAIWLAMLGVGVMLVVKPFYFGAVFLGAAIGAALRIHQRRRRRARIAGAPSAPRERSRSAPRERSRRR